MLTWAFLARRAVVTQSGWIQSTLRFAPWVGRLNEVGRLATFTDLLALFVEHQVPMHEALPLAADATGDRRMGEECEQLAIDIKKGSSVMRSVSDAVTVPNLIRWQLTSGMPEQELARSLRSSSRNYRYQAEAIADKCAVRLPVYFTVFIGGTATLLYAIVVLLPWFSLLESLAF